MDNSSISVDSLGARPGYRIHDRWIHSPADSNCRCGSAIQDNLRSTNSLTQTVIRKEHS